MDAAFQSASSDRHETTNNPNIDYAGNSGTKNPNIDDGGNSGTKNPNIDDGGNSGTKNPNIDDGDNSGTQMNRRPAEIQREESSSSDHHEITNNTNVVVGGNPGTQINRRPADNERQELMEECPVCTEEVDSNQMHENMFCHHRFCFSCMSSHVIARLEDYDGVPGCPVEQCTSGLTKDDCEKFLKPSNWLDIFKMRLKEAEIPDSEKVYCPYKDCSVLMALSGLERCPQPPPPSSSSSSSSSQPSPTTAAKCQTCHRLFCIECRVPWHTDVSCQDYASELCGPDVDLLLLAEDKKWKRCPKCKHMIGRSTGCIYMVCRCGSMFCYECGLKSQNRRLLCMCRGHEDDYDSLSD